MTNALPFAVVIVVVVEIIDLNDVETAEMYVKDVLEASAWFGQRDSRGLSKEMTGMAVKLNSMAVELKMIVAHY